MVARAEEAQPGRLRTVLAKIVLPADDWAKRGDERRPSTLTALMWTLIAILALAAFAGVHLWREPEAAPSVLVALLVLLALGAGIVLVLMHQVRRHLLEPLAQLNDWALSMCDGNLSARIPAAQTGQFAKLTYHINRLSEALERLANEMDDAVWAQTERLQQKNQSLEILYEIAAAINVSQSLHELLKWSARKLMEAVSARGATVHLRNAAEVLECIERIEQPPDSAARGPSRLADAIGEVERTLATEPAADDVEVTTVATNGAELSIVTVPLRYQQRVLGLLRLYSHESLTPEARKLLTNVGKHLGMAIAKARLDEESRNLSLMRARTSLAHELHDSLAQTLAGLRFQVRMLSETVAQLDAPAARSEMARVEASLDEANTEVRELIASFRTPVDARGLLPALEDAVARFRKESNVPIYLQSECEHVQLSPAAELQVLRIVREALTNVRKHSGAQTVRVFLRQDANGDYRILVEDDGRGYCAPVLRGHPGEHIGLSIMQERARRLGGTLSIESEPGDGTRVTLRFPAKSSEPPVELYANVS